MQLDYLSALSTLHRELEAERYVEIGCRLGASLSLAKARAVAIDPDFEIRFPLAGTVSLFKETSDDFFSRRDLSAILGGTFDLGFIDGMHRAEFVLRDFINLERHAHPGSVLVIDDVLPQNMSWTTRKRETQAWTGDVYRIVPFLRHVRPDLKVEVFDIDMKGLAVVSGLDPSHAQGDLLPDGWEEQILSERFGCSSIEEIRATLRPRPVSEFEQHAQALSKACGPQNGDQVDAAGIYLDLLKRSLLNEIYLDDELRLLYLKDCLAGSETFNYQVLHDIRNSRREAYDDLKAMRQIGRFPERNVHRSGFSHTMIGRKRIDSLHQCLDIVRQENIPGDFVECGVWRGGSCIFMAGYAAVHGMNGRTVHVADSFEGLPVPNHELDARFDLSKEKFPELAVPMEMVRENFDVNGIDTTNVHFLKGWFKDTLKSAEIGDIALLRLDGDLYESTMDALEALYARVVPGGIVIIDDYNALPVCRQAVHDYLSAHLLPEPEIELIDWTGAWWRKP